jgi:polyferredoxin
MTYGLITRQTLDLNVIRDRSPPYVRLADGSIRNDFALKVINMQPGERQVSIGVTGIEGARLQAREWTFDAQGRVIVRAQGDSVTNVRLHLVAPGDVAPGSHRLVFTLRDLEAGETATSASAFLAGAPR